jgi:hypothetical protein
MNNIFATTTPIQFAPIQTDLRNWRLVGMEMEALGTRLDAAREALANARTAWARWYWTETVDRLMLQWRNIVPLHEGEARMSQIPRWQTDYEWWEGAQELTYSGLEGITDRLFDKIFRVDDLEAVWRRKRDERLMKCNCQ